MRFSFESVDARDYDELRPGYALDAVRWVAERADLAAESLVVDLAAGTGQLARRFAEINVGVLAVEPAANMREVLGSNLPIVRTVAGAAERIPLAEGEADAVVVGNAFHHFDGPSAFAEIRRVLRPGGALALFWARSEESGSPISSIVREVDAVVARSLASSPIVHAYRSWFEPHERAEGFTAFEHRSFPTTHAVPADRLADLFATSSDVASLPVGERTAVLQRIAVLSRSLPRTLELPGRSDVHLCFRT